MLYRRADLLFLYIDVVMVSENKPGKRGCVRTDGEEEFLEQYRKGRMRGSSADIESY